MTDGYYRFDGRTVQFSFIPKRVLVDVLLASVLLCCVVLMYESVAVYELPVMEAFDVCRWCRSIGRCHS